MSGSLVLGTIQAPRLQSPSVTQNAGLRHTTRQIQIAYGYVPDERLNLMPGTSAIQG